MTEAALTRLGIRISSRASVIAGALSLNLAIRGVLSFGLFLADLAASSSRLSLAH